MKKIRAAKAKVLEFADHSMTAPVSAAIYSKDEELAVVLLDGGADPNEFDEKGCNALHWAAQKGCSQPLLRRILDMIHDVNAPSNYNHNKNTALIIAASSNQVNVFTSLMNMPGIDVNRQQSSYNRTALHIAARHNRPHMVEQLLHANADTSVKDMHNRTPLDLAIHKNSHDCVTLLLKHIPPGGK